MTIKKKIKKLKRLKDIREKKRDDVRIRLKDTEEKKRALEERSGDLDIKREDAVFLFKEKCINGEISPEELLWMRDGIDDLEKDIEQLDILIDEINQSVVCLKDDLKDKHVDVKITGIFLDKRNMEQKQQDLKNEQRELDEFTLLSFVK